MGCGSRLNQLVESLEVGANLFIQWIEVKSCHEILANYVEWAVKLELSDREPLKCCGEQAWVRFQRKRQDSDAQFQTPNIVAAD